MRSCQALRFLSFILFISASTAAAQPVAPRTPLRVVSAGPTGEVATAQEANEVRVNGPRHGDNPVPCAWHHRSEEGLLTIYPPEYRAWAAGAGVRAVVPERRAALRDDDAAPASPKLRSSESGPKPHSGEEGGIRIVNPPAGAIYSVDPTLRRDFQALPLRVVTSRPTTVTWLVDGARIGTASSEQSLAWPLAVGAHRIEVRDAAGRRATTSVIVK